MVEGASKFINQVALFQRFRSRFWVIFHDKIAGFGVFVIYYQIHLFVLVYTFSVIVNQFFDYSFVEFIIGMHLVAVINWNYGF